MDAAWQPADAAAMVALKCQSSTTSQALPARLQQPSAVGIEQVLTAAVHSSSGDQQRTGVLKQVPVQQRQKVSQQQQQQQYRSQQQQQEQQLKQREFNNFPSGSREVQGAAMVPEDNGHSAYQVACKQQQHRQQLNSLSTQSQSSCQSNISQDEKHINNSAVGDRQPWHRHQHRQQQQHTPQARDVLQLSNCPSQLEQLAGRSSVVDADKEQQQQQECLSPSAGCERPNMSAKQFLDQLQLDAATVRTLTVDKQLRAVLEGVIQQHCKPQKPSQVQQQNSQAHTVDKQTAKHVKQHSLGQSQPEQQQDLSPAVSNWLEDLGQVALLTGVEVGEQQLVAQADSYNTTGNSSSSISASVAQGERSGESLTASACKSQQEALSSLKPSALGRLRQSLEHRQLQRLRHNVLESAESAGVEAAAASMPATAAAGSGSSEAAVGAVPSAAATADGTAPTAASLDPKMNAQPKEPHRSVEQTISIVEQHVAALHSGGEAEAPMLLNAAVAAGIAADSAADMFAAEHNFTSDHAAVSAALAGADNGVRVAGQAAVLAAAAAAAAGSKSSQDTAGQSHTPVPSLCAADAVDSTPSPPAAAALAAAGVPASSNASGSAAVEKLGTILAYLDAVEADAEEEAAAIICRLPTGAGSISRYWSKCNCVLRT
jgi:hypothetical protein